MRSGWATRTADASRALARPRGAHQRRCAVARPRSTLRPAVSFRGRWSLDRGQLADPPIELVLRYPRYTHAPSRPARAAQGARSSAGRRGSAAALGSRALSGVAGRCFTVLVLPPLAGFRTAVGLRRPRTRPPSRVPAAGGGPRPRLARPSAGGLPRARKGVCGGAREEAPRPPPRRSPRSRPAAPRRLPVSACRPRPRAAASELAGAEPRVLPAAAGSAVG